MTSYILHAPGDVISSRYRIASLLGKGGMSETYEAEDLTSHQRVALKVLSLRQMTEWKTLELFEREAKTLAQLDHPGIPNYLDSFHLDVDSVGALRGVDLGSGSAELGSSEFGRSESGSSELKSSVEDITVSGPATGDRHFYLVRELVSGESLADRIGKGWRPDEAELREIAVQILDILTYLHQLSPPLIHRDIKPQNIIRQPDGTVFLVDFGSVQEIYRETFLGSNTFVGTAGYMPPEQFRGQTIPASDLYGLGATLIYLATQRTPDQLPQARMKVDVDACTQFSPSFTAWLDKLLEPIPEDRFQTAAATLKQLTVAPPASGGFSYPFTLDGNATEHLTPVSKPIGAISTVERSPHHLRITIPLAQSRPPFWAIQSLWGVAKQAALSIGQYGQQAIRGIRQQWRIQKETAVVIIIFGMIFGLPFLIMIISMLLMVAQSALVLSPLLLLTLLPFGPAYDTLTLDITSESFAFLYSKHGKVRRIKEGRSLTLYASLGPEQADAKLPRIACTLTERLSTNQYNMHYFGQNLSATEQEWLVDEISSFLKSIKFL